jgi:serine/threonine-protein kinase
VAERGAALDLSPDGGTLAFVGCERPCGAGEPREIFLRRLDRLDARRVPGTVGAGTVSFSRDGEALMFSTARGMQTLRLAEGTPVEVLEGMVPLGRMGAGGVIVVGGLPGEGLRRVSSPGAEPEALTRAAKTEFHQSPEILPGGTVAVFTIFDGAGLPEVAVVPLDGGEARALGLQGSYPRYSLSGHLLLTRAGSLLAAPFDLEALEVTGPAVPVVDGLPEAPFLGGGPQYSLADNGTLAYRRNLGGDARAGRTLVWVDREGREEEVAGTTPRAYRGLDLSPDGADLAAVVGQGEESGLWNLDLERATSTRFSAGAEIAPPVWSPDGSRLAFVRDSGGGVFWQAADGTGPVERLLEAGRLQVPAGFSPDGSTLILTGFSAELAEGIGMVRVPGDQSYEVLIDSPAREWEPALSPDGRWLAYSSDESGRFEIYVRPFPEVDSGRTVVSSDGGRDPAWSPDGRELFYESVQGMAVVAVETTPSFSAGAPRILFDKSPYLAGRGGWSYDVAPDGQRLLMVKLAAATGAESAEIVVVQNWFAELERLVPTD